jgi:hypothetical protein
MKKHSHKFRENFPRLSFCDATTIVILNDLGIRILASYDERSFKGLVDEIYGFDYFESLPKEENTQIRKKILKK